jgi:hypothetical protein
VLNQTHSVGDKTWIWNGVAWAVQRTSVTGKSAYDLAIEKGFVGTEAAWIASLKGERGLQGEQGPIGLSGLRGEKGDPGANGIDGINGIDGVNGQGVPEGGIVGQVLQKNSSDPFDISWVTPDYLSDYTVPLGGNAGQYLGKNSSAAGDFAWKDLPILDGGTPELPSGGNEGQVLTKNSAASGDYSWGDQLAAAGLPAGGTVGQILIKNSEFDGDATWQDATSIPSDSFPEAPEDGLYYVRQNRQWVEMPASSGPAVDVPYIIPAFTAYAPEQSETLLDHIFVTPVTFPANFAGSQGSVGNNPASTYVFDLLNNNISVGSITIAVDGTTTFATVNGADLIFVPGDLLSIICPAVPDLSIARVRISLLGTRN